MIDYLSIAFVSVIVFLVGWLWYSPLMFGKQWLKLMNIKKPQKAPELKTILIGFIATFFICFILDYLLTMLGIVTFGLGASIGAVIWFGFVATIMINPVIYEKQHLEMYIINVLHYLVVLSLAGGLLAIW